MHGRGAGGTLHVVPPALIFTLTPPYP